MIGRRPAEVFPPGEAIKDELEARGWAQADLAGMLARDANEISLILAGQAEITPDTAKRLGEVFGTSAQFWLNLESSYQLWR